MLDFSSSLLIISRFCLCYVLCISEICWSCIVILFWILLISLSLRAIFCSIRLTCSITFLISSSFSSAIDYNLELKFFCFVFKDELSSVICVLRTEISSFLSKISAFRTCLSFSSCEMICSYLSCSSLNFWVYSSFAALDLSTSSLSFSSCLHYEVTSLKSLIKTSIFFVKAALSYLF